MSLTVEDPVAFVYSRSRGRLTLPPGRFERCFRPAFRSSGTGVIHSDIVPLGTAYALLELRGDDTSMRLQVEGGGKNAERISISLYTNGDLLEKSFLGARRSWDLGSFQPGSYRLECNNVTALSFQIQE